MNDRQEAFCLRYVVHFNATKAAQEAGYAERTAYQQGYRLLQRQDVQERIAALFEPMKAEAAEVSARLAAQARGLAPTEWTEDANGKVTGSKFQPLAALDKLARATGLYAGEEDDRAVKVLIVRSADEVDPEEFMPKGGRFLNPATNGGNGNGQG